MKIETHIPLIESILREWKEQIGDQFDPYKNHVYRVVNFCFAFHKCQGDDADKLAIAGAFHDIGLWSANTVDYLAPSVREGKAEWSEEIGLMIDLHHKFRAVKLPRLPLVEVFRKGDWVDASMGLRSFGLPRADVKAVQAAFANLGFHKNLMRLATLELFKHGRNPVPMMRW